MFDNFSEHREESWNVTHSRVFLMNFKAFGQLLSWVFDIIIFSTETKTKEKTETFSKSMLIKIRYPNTVMVVISVI